MLKSVPFGVPGVLRGGVRCWQTLVSGPIVDVSYQHLRHPPLDPAAVVVERERRSKMAAWSRGRQDLWIAWACESCRPVAWLPWRVGEEVPEDRVAFVLAVADLLEATRATLDVGHRNGIVLKRLDEMRSDSAAHVWRLDGGPGYAQERAVFVPAPVPPSVPIPERAVWASRQLSLFSMPSVVVPWQARCGTCRQAGWGAVCVDCYRAQARRGASSSVRYPDGSLQCWSRERGTIYMPPVPASAAAVVCDAVPGCETCDEGGEVGAAPGKGFALLIDPTPPNRTNTIGVPSRRDAAGWVDRLQRRPDPPARQVERLTPKLEAKAAAKLREAGIAPAIYGEDGLQSDWRVAELVALAWASIYERAAADGVALLADGLAVSVADGRMTDDLRRERLRHRGRDIERWKTSAVTAAGLDPEHDDYEQRVQQLDIIPDHALPPLSLNDTSDERVGGGALLDAQQLAREDAMDVRMVEAWGLVTGSTILTDDDWTLLDHLIEAGTDAALAAVLDTTPEGARKKRVRLAGKLLNLRALLDGD